MFFLLQPDQGGAGLDLVAGLGEALRRTTNMSIGIVTKARAKLAFGSIIPSRQGARAQVLRVFAVDGPAVAQDGSAADDLPQP
ncbi:hypothetical protein VB636_00720, partial [Paracoccus sp. APAP_BH8]|uniref:hypothetical protein n=1 Tax=Paracoccus sp. APAP_BH8 TaxID=3110237 RepID=UPI002FD81175